jgi:hypothetical protein
LKFFKESSTSKVVVEAVKLGYFVEQLRETLKRGDTRLLRLLVEDPETRFDDNYAYWTRRTL